VCYRQRDSTFAAVAYNNPISATSTRDWCAG